MPDNKAVPQRGDGFDSVGRDAEVPVGSSGSVSAPRGLSYLDKLNVSELAAALGTDEKSAQVIKDLAIVGGASVGAIAAAKLNKALGDLVGEEWAAGIGGFFGAFGGTMLGKKVGGNSLGKKKPRRR